MGRARFRLGYRDSGFGQRVGSLAGKIATSMNRHDAANQPQLAQDLLAPLGHEPSVVCAEYQAGGQLVARYPQGLGCRNAVFDDSIDLALGPETFLRVALTEDNWQALVNAQLRNSVISQAAAFVVALIAASIGFQILVSRRLARLTSHPASRHQARANHDRRKRPGRDQRIGRRIQSTSQDRNPA